MSLKTYQDYLKAGQEDITTFIEDVISCYKYSDIYEQAEIAQDYAAHKNRTIIEYQKLLYTVSGEVMPDNYSANYKLCSNFFGRFVGQQVQHLLGNGVTWEKEDTKKKLGKNFEEKLQRVAHDALVSGIGYGFFNHDHLDVFDALEFAPIWDEVDGSLKAGVRFWQIDSSKPLRATFYEEDGYTEFIREDGKWDVLKDKKTYIEKITASEADLADGTAYYEGMNYPTFPIIPLWGNNYHQSELVGIREQIDCYDLVKSGYANTIDEASFIYWSINNAGGMDELDISEFINRLRRLRAAITTDFNASAEPHQIEAPFQARGELLDRLRADLYEDYQALDTKNLASGAVTATQIEAAYEPMNLKADAFEYLVTAFVEGILKVAGIEDKPTYTRSMIMNRTEEIQAVINAATILPPDYTLQKVLTILGDGDKYDDIQAEIDAEEIEQIIPELEEEEQEVE